MVYENTITAFGRRNKKLIAAARCEFGDIAKIAFDCKLCSDEERERRGCIEPVEYEIWSIKPCFVCEGENKKCRMCHGSNAICVNRCPRSIVADNSWLYRLLPYFFEYYYSTANSGAHRWPDGKASYLQPVKLKKAFEILSEEYLKATKKDGGGTTNTDNGAK